MLSVRFRIIIRTRREKYIKHFVYTTDIRCFVRSVYHIHVIEMQHTFYILYSVQLRVMSSRVLYSDLFEIYREIKIDGKTPGSNLEVLRDYMISYMSLYNIIF